LMGLPRVGYHALAMKKPVVPSMKKTVRRATLLEDLLSDLLEIEDLLMKMELKNALDPATEKQRRLYKEAHATLRELVRDLTDDLAQEHTAA